MSLNDTPRGNRFHIGFFGKRNAGKSSLVNALTGQNASIVSPVAGTTADPVFKPMEIKGIGACEIIDTAGLDDWGGLGRLRVEKTLDAAKRCDLAVIVLSEDDASDEERFAADFAKRGVPVLFVINDKGNADNLLKRFSDASVVNALMGAGLEEFKKRLVALADKKTQSLLRGLAKEGDTVLLVMPQDIQAPEGRLILPQVQTIRELLDKKCAAVCCTADKFEETLAILKKPPELIVTDSQVFGAVFEKKPQSSLLTSFSVLFAAEKGDLDYFIEGAKAIAGLKPDAKILVAEACTHAPLSEDVGRVKLPAALKKRLGDGIKIDVVSGADFPDDLSGYDLVIHCGGCMFNRRHVMSRVESARAQGAPMTNYGVALAYLNGILDKIVY